MQQVLRSNLNAANFPFTSPWMGRSIILPQWDQNYERTISSAADQDKDKGIPQVFYMHNCMPTPQGFQSVGFEKVVKGIGVTNFDQCFTIRDSAENKMLFSPSSGKNYVYDVPVGSWASINPITPTLLPARALVTHAYIHANTYIYYEKYGCFKYNSTTKQMDPITLNGLVTATIRGICHAAGYMVAFDVNNTAYWSSATVETDFIPSLVTGAGSGAITELRGRIIGILPINSGFMVYTTNNVVSATFSGNVRYPFIFKEVETSCGIQDIESVTYDADWSEHYTWSSSGVQKVNKAAAAFVYPEVTDFITSKLFEDFDETSLLFTVTKMTTEMKTKLTIIGRFFIFSYGIDTLTHALVFDTALKRWGKVKIDHADCFEYTYPNFYGTRTYGQLLGYSYADLLGTSYGELSSGQNTGQTPKKIVGFLQQDGTIQLLDYDLTLSAPGVFMIGKYQFTRSRLFTLQSVEVENPGLNGNFDAYALVSTDGKNLPIVPVPLYNQINTQNLKTYLAKLTGINATVLFVGAFYLDTILIRFTKHGQR